MVDDDSGQALRHFSRFHSRRSRKKVPALFCWSFLRFLYSFPPLFLSVSHLVLTLSSERERTGARIMGWEGTTLGFYSWGIKYEQSVREVKPYLLFENQCRIRERNDDNRHSRQPLPVTVTFLLSTSFLFFSLSFFVCLFWFARRMYCVYKSLLARVCIQWCPMYMWV